MNLFIESIEGGTYVAGYGEEKADTLLRHKQTNSLSFLCINSIKQQTQGADFEKVWLKQNTPYEEMCGLKSSDESLDIELEW
jgi:hypothetical protein